MVPWGPPASPAGLGGSIADRAPNSACNDSDGAAEASADTAGLGVVPSDGRGERESDMGGGAGGGRAGANVLPVALILRQPFPHGILCICTV